MKKFMKIHNYDKFHQYILCGCQVKFFVPIQHPCWVHFGTGGVFCLFLFNMWSNFGQTLTPMLLPEDGRNWKKNSCPKKNLLSGHPNISKLLALFWEN